MSGKDSFWIIVAGLLVFGFLFFWWLYLICGLVSLIVLIARTNRVLNAYKNLKGQMIKYEGKPYLVTRVKNTEHIEIEGVDQDKRIINTRQWELWTEKDQEQWQKAQQV